MEYSKQKMPDDQFFGSGYKVETFSSLTARKLAVHFHQQKNDFEIQQLSVSEKLKPIERFKYILLNGSDIQKWSVFENITSIVTEQKHIKVALELILSFSKDESKELFGVMGFGLVELLESPLVFSSSQLDSLTTFSFKILGYQETSIVDEWIQLLKLLFLKNQKVLKTVEEYVSDSFDFKAPEHRRLIGKYLLTRDKYSQKFRKETIKKLLLFTQDRNKLCRESICNIFGKLLKSNPNSEDLWKVIIDYSKDKDSMEVRQLAVIILTTVYRAQNFESIIHLFQSKDSSSVINHHLPNFLKIFNNQIRNQQTRNMFLNMINGGLKGKGEGLSPCCIKNIIALTEVYGLKFLSDLSQTLMKVANNPENFNKFISLFSSLPQQQRPLEFRNVFYQILKTNNYVFGEVAEQISKCLSVQNQNDLDVCIKLCVKSLEASLWNAQKIYLQTLKKWKYSKLYFDRVVLLVTKHLLVCPQFLNEPIFEIIKHLLLMNKKRRDFMFTLKQKMANSKCWIQRRNFIQIYEYLYKNCSWQLINQITPLPMYIFIHQKVMNIKLEQCKFIANVYQHINPSQATIKSTLKQHLVKYSEDKNPLLCEFATNCLKIVNKVDNGSKAQDIFNRNNEFLHEQNLFQQIQEQPLIKQVTTYKALVNSKQNLSISKRPENKKISITGKRELPQQQSTQFKKVIGNPTPVSRKSAILKSPTLPIDLGKVPRKSDKK